MARLLHCLVMRAGDPDEAAPKAVAAACRRTLDAGNRIAANTYED